MGIDRLVMFLTNSTSTFHELMWVTTQDPLLMLNALCGFIDIKEVLLFPAMKPEQGQTAPVPGITAAGPTGQL